MSNLRKKIDSSIVPNLFIVGVPKAGTTTLARWLSDHPEIATSIEAEPRFLLDADDPMSRRDGFHQSGLNGYERYFPPASAEVKYLLDASPEYYYQVTAKSVISSLKDRTVIMILREPSQRALSLFRYAQQNMGVLPKNLSFQDFLVEVNIGNSSKKIGQHPMLYKCLQHGNYANYVRIWRNALGESNLKVFIFEELFANPKKYIKSIARELGVIETFYNDYTFPKENETFVVRNRSFHRLMRQYRGHAGDTRLRKLTKKIYLWVNTTQSKGTVDQQTAFALKRLRLQFEEPNRELQRELGRAHPIWSGTGY